ncbi:Sensor_kinase_SpoOB-type, alpha-helical domain [Paenibacillus catalpae]|uniref:Sensor_kinase_SpoOB-type, alpha-helical domain n=1 Tax=Paenibacillus catalpae TaxID=1045775 RepID=A0A1I1YYF1_9BACL|nr:Spo0B domain-containing protein [Paenibacillus catalpae]SFE24499.1 Sensor_kinase_SpoOB-type, alpha-helical domain [Paenibacillus catalpae]
MDRIRMARQSAAASVVLPGAAVLIWPSSVWLVALFLLWTIAAAVFWIKTERKEQEQRLARTVQRLQTASVKTLNHHRHDWMNDLQVLFGYIRMNKLDKTVEYVEKIRVRMTEESQIAKLGVPSLISYIQSFRTLTNAMQLHVKVDEGIHLNELQDEGRDIADTLISLINAYRFSVKTGYGDPASLTLKLSRDEEMLTVAFYYEGDLTSEQQLADKIKQQLEGASLLPVDVEHPQRELVLKAEWRA